MSEYVPYTNLLQLTMWPGTLVYLHFTLLAHALNICLPHCINIFHCTATIVYIWSHITSHKCLKIITTATLIYHVIIAFKCHIYATYANYFLCRYQTTMSVYIPHMYSCNQQCHHKLWYTYISHFGTCQWKKYLSQHRCMSQYTNNVVYIYIPHYCIYK